MLCYRWLIAIAFWLAGAFIKSGLGNRIAYTIVNLFGKTTLGLTYSLVIAEALLSPAIPSVAARAGGIFFPIAKALCLACGSDPENGTEKVMGSYLMKARFCACVAVALRSSCMCCRATLGSDVPGWPAVSLTAPARCCQAACTQHCL